MFWIMKTAISSFSKGTIMYLAVWKSDKPSTLAESNMLWGIPRKAAIVMITFNPMYIQLIVIRTERRAVLMSPNHALVSACNPTLSREAFITPNIGLYIHVHTIATATSDITIGRKIITKNTLPTFACLVITMAIAIPTGIWIKHDWTAIIVTFTKAFLKVGSSKRRFLKLSRPVNWGVGDMIDHRKKLR